MLDRARIVQVAVDAPLDGVLDYAIEIDATDLPPVGGRVTVPLGHGQRQGVVAGHGPSDEALGHEVRSIVAALDTQALYSPADLRFADWLSRYYHAPLGEVLSQMMPLALREGGAAELVPPMVWRLTLDAPAGNPRSARQTALLARFRQSGGQLGDGMLRGESAALRALADKGWIQRVAQDSSDLGSLAARDDDLALNAGQAMASGSITDALGQFTAFLLHGITGSGKTEVYLAAAHEVLARDGQVLVLVPEIALTPQLVNRFSDRFGSGLVVLHSGMTDSARREAWLQARAGLARVVLGTRSALLTPMPRLGLIVVDEEHDGSYKQQEGMRYHARDAAVVRARQCGVPVILGSATPSLETLANVEQGRYQLLRLDERAGGAKPPRLELLDVRRRPMREGLSAPLVERMRAHLGAGGQVLLFLNRRGFAPSLMCHACGEVEHCRQCSSPMTVHRGRGRLVCHHCGAERPIPRSCSACGSTDLDMPGQGTERLEAVLTGLFPEFPLERVDRDTTRRKGSLEAKLARARSGEARILLGTQMLAKGHDFPGVTLAAVINADGGLFSSDFRAPERLIQLVVQVAGRAGRAERAGEVLIQTHQPDHPLFQGLLRGGFDACARVLMEERRLANLPPFNHLALLRAESKDGGRARALLQRSAAWINEMPMLVQTYGPAPAPLERRAGRYRHQLLLSSRMRPELHFLLDSLLPALRIWPEGRGVRWSVDVDPQDMG